MTYISPRPNLSGAYSGPQSNNAPGLVLLPSAFQEILVRYNGFVTIEHDGSMVTECTPNIEAWEEWKLSLPSERDKTDYITEAEAVTMLFGGDSSAT